MPRGRLRRGWVHACVVFVAVAAVARGLRWLLQPSAPHTLPVRPFLTPARHVQRLPPIDPLANATVGPEAFPPAYPDTTFAAAYTGSYPDGDPHRGIIPPAARAMLDATPALVPPPYPPPLPAANHTVWTHRPWTRALNGSRTAAEDAAHPARQPVEADWRPIPFNAWQPPLANLSQGAPPLPRIQYPFPAASQFSGMQDPARDAVVAARQDAVRRAFVRAWQGYKTHAWGADELRPVSNDSHNNFNGWGATIVDSLDTLLVMGLHDEYTLARNHVNDVDFHYVGGERSAYGSADGRVPVFETGIRYLGGLLSAYDLTGDALMRDRAEELAQLILPAFDTLTGLPVGRMRLADTKPYTTSEPRGRHESVVLSEAGSMLLEFTRLWQVTGNRTYLDRVQRVTDYIDRNLTSKSLLGTLIPTRIYPESRAVAGKYTFGGQADSYYEYLVKEHQLLGGRLAQYPRMYGDAMDSALQYLIKDIRTVPHADFLAVVSETVTPDTQPGLKLEHLGCFAGGMMALGSRLLPERHTDLNVARRLTESCWWAYNASKTGIAPEELTFFHPDDVGRYEVEEDAHGVRHRLGPAGYPFTGVQDGYGPYHNRPETIESVFYMYRITGDRVWQERGWQMFASWMTHALVPGGVSGIRDVHRTPVQHTDSMESFTLAETFKYYYLLFSPPDLVSLDDFVLTTEAHLFLAPQNGQWAQPGAIPPSMRRWTPPPPCIPAEIYCGGEMGVRGALSHAQKRDLRTKTKVSKAPKILETLLGKEQAAEIANTYIPKGFNAGGAGQPPAWAGAWHGKGDQSQSAQSASSMHAAN